MGSVKKTFNESHEAVAAELKKIGEELKKSSFQISLESLVWLETQRMKEDHKKMMKEARKTLAWLLLLSFVAWAYQVWGIPFLEKKFLNLESPIANPARK
jgi:hypothetical protein